MYQDFNSTIGLVFNGNAGTSNCIHVQQNMYSALHGIHDQRNATLEETMVLEAFHCI